MISWCVLFRDVSFLHRRKHFHSASHSSSLSNNPYTHPNRRPQISHLPALEWPALPSFLPHSSPRSQTSQHPHNFRRRSQNWRLGSCAHHISTSPAAPCRRQGGRDDMVPCSGAPHG